MGGYQPGRTPGDGPTEWIWLLHDDCEPDPGALAELLRGAAETPGGAVLGPKVLDWSDRRVGPRARLTHEKAGGGAPAPPPPGSTPGGAARGRGEGARGGGR